MVAFNNASQGDVRRNMSKKAFEPLPQGIIEKSISEREIVVPLKEALKAVDIMEIKACSSLAGKAG